MKEKLVKESKFLLPLDLQFHADGEGETDGGNESNQEGVQEQAVESTPAEATQQAETTKTFTQEDVNAIAAKEAKRATEKILKQLGVTDFTTAKEGLAKYQEILDSQKTDAQKAAEKAQELEQQNNTLLTAKETLEAELAALKSDVNPEFVNDVVVLAKNLLNDDTDMNAAIQKVVEKYPNFKRVTQQEEDKTKKPKFSQGDHQSGAKPSEQDAWASAFKFN